MHNLGLESHGFAHGPSGLPEAGDCLLLGGCHVRSPVQFRVQSYAQIFGAAFKLQIAVK